MTTDNRERGRERERERERDRDKRDKFLWKKNMKIL